MDNILDSLKKGDVITHIYTRYPYSFSFCHQQIGNASFSRFVDAVKEKGVLLDLGMGNESFSINRTKELLDLGLEPDILSSDQHLNDLSNVSSFQRTTSEGIWGIITRFLALGFKLEALVAKVTINPARALKISDTMGVLDVGRNADLCVFKTVDVPRFKLTSSPSEIGFENSGSLWIDKVALPVFLIHKGKVIPVNGGLLYPQRFNPELLLSPYG
jgi:dihydroorotase